MLTSQLSHYLNTSQLALQLVDTQQLKKRLCKLLPTRLNQIKIMLHKTNSISKAQRYALVHPKYLKYIEELLNIKSHYNYLRVEWELCYMQRFLPLDRKKQFF